LAGQQNLGKSISENNPSVHRLVVKIDKISPVIWNFKRRTQFFPELFFHDIAYSADILMINVDRFCL
jgi:hypothetical protein